MSAALIFLGRVLGSISCEVSYDFFPRDDVASLELAHLDVLLCPLGSNLGNTILSRFGSWSNWYAWAKYSILTHRRSQKSLANCWDVSLHK